MINYAKVYADALAQVCCPGEQVVDVISATYTTGRERDSGEKNTVTFDPIHGLSVEAWNDAAAEAIGGLTLDLRRGRQAGELAKAADSTSAFLVLTTQRLLMLESLQSSAETTVSWSTELRDVAVLRHDPRLPLELGRLLVGFMDGSLVRLWAGILLPFAARRFAASYDNDVRH